MRLRALAVAALVALLAAACGSAPGRIGPTGVDQLTIPTPSPRAEDFVRVVDNGWLPLTPGARWEYTLTGGSARFAVASVTANRPEISGIVTTELLTVFSDAAGRTVRRTWEWFAQDGSGNVWLFGVRGAGAGSAPSWRAGEAGAQAGLAMPAQPRFGDGYALERAPGVAEDRARVLSVSETLQALGERRTQVVLLRVSSPLAPGRERLSWYAPGLGLVQQNGPAGAGQTLTSYDAGAG